MSLHSPKVSPFLWIYFLPVALVALAASAFNLISLERLSARQAAAAQEQSRDLARIHASERFNRELAAVQNLVGTTLEQAGAGWLDAGRIYRLHTEVVERLAALEGQLTALHDLDPGADLAVIRDDFDAYRRFITQATDLAAIDPEGALHNTYQAARRFVDLVAHTHRIAAAFADTASDNSQTLARAFERETIQITAATAILMASLLLLWLIVAQRVARRVSTITRALQHLAAGEVEAEALSAVQAIGRNAGSVLKDIAQSVLAFRDTVIAGEATR